MHNSHVILHLSLIDGVGPATIAKIGNWVVNNSGNWGVLYDLTPSQLAQLCQISMTVARTVAAGLSDKTVLDAELALIAKHRISWTTVYEDSYPSLLKNIHTPPAVLYWRGGTINQLGCVAVIGSRRANQYGQRVVNRLVPQLVAHGATIVSGGAIGADTMAHRAALAAGGNTFAVLGSGLLKPYPRVNEKLFETIIDGHGALVSSFPLMTSPVPGNFPARNRIIAGLSSACIVVQAAAQSGAAITAEYALQEGRDVFAVPGAIDDELSAGCHALIAQGATLLHDVSYLYDTVNEFTPGHVQKSSSDGKGVLDSVTPDAMPPVSTESTVSDTVINLCRRPQSLDDLMIGTGYTAEQLQDVLFDLQLSGRLVQDFAGMWFAS